MALQPKRRKTPCERCNWKFEGFHVCFDASKKVAGEGRLTDPKSKLKKRNHDIVQAYLDGSSLRDVADDFNLSQTSIFRILRDHEEDTGKRIMRDRHNREVVDA